ncbi:hypothetical protein UCRPA7_8462 [Phaeoacremonium minimum UCRPA7]|uniref:DUF7907 domain-containing protein n=1 Tax=Phaeoacremonium minimum (strain UCR-PA7) TaxID=1286976 RepID=R8B9R5_PHAM7|nr:hypothetical protein UCRPA7_8462 [Phaeoacremonium minimum UCRPA7]EON96038.1 hypothetical protein UCRPA7_8462 [Phaeoacremonium minimum UCRPA7]
MYTPLIALSLAVLTTAAPSGKRQVPHYPPTSQSQGFKLIANVTDPSADFTPSIKNWVVEGAHTGAGTNVAVLKPFDATTSPGRTFYLNGTAEDVRYGNTNVLTDGGTPPAPYGIYVQNQTEFEYLYPDEHGVGISVGEGSGTSLTRFPNPYPYLTSATGTGTFVACNNTVAYYGTKFITLEYAYATFTAPDGSYEYNANIPEGCAAVNLIPQCTELNELPEDAYSSHEFAAQTACYPDVAAIDWTQYGP